MAVKLRKKKSKKAEGTPEEIALFKHLSNFLSDENVTVRVEKGRFRGGFCMVEGDQQIIILNKTHTLDSRIITIATEIRRRELLEKLPTDILTAIKPYLDTIDSDK